MGGGVVLWGFLVRGIGFRYRVALLSGFWAGFAAIAASSV